jgi:hypothetical protein
MELKDFVSATLREIIDGVLDAQNYVAEKQIPARVNPVKDGSRMHLGRRMPTQTRTRQNIEFDVAVTTAEGAERKGGAGVFVASFGFGGSAKDERSSQSAARVKFSVPVILPADGWSAADKTEGQ